MKTLLGRLRLCVLFSMLSTVLIGPGLASAQSSSPWATPLAVTPGSDAVLYEATEDMRLLGGRLIHRKAISSLMGVARPGTPLCPMTTNCTMNATGSDNINLATGLGTASGSFTVVVQGDNPTDSPELVVMTGRFSGNMDFSPALNGIPYGTITGKLTVDGARGAIPFTGTFRMPVLPPVFDLTCVTTNPDPFACITGWGAPSYLTDPAAFPFGFAPLKANEFALGWPTVKFEIKF